MAKVKQLTVALENRPGTLAHVAKVLADAKVNVLSLLGSTAEAQGSVQVVVDNVNKAKKALGGAGLAYTEGTLEEYELPNKPGALAQLAGRLAKKGATAFIPDVSANSSDFCLQPCSIITSGEGTRGS